MKLIKKIAAIMLSVMMVLGMASVVSADEGETAASATTGTITITDALVGQKYKIYKILELESFSGTDDTGNYAYKIDSNWENFIKGTAEGEGTGNEYLEIIDTTYNYVRWKGEKNDARVAEFAKKALEYAKSKKINPDRISNDTTSTTVTFNNLPLGYYVVESSVGALCGLTTTNPTATIQEKNGVPSVEKKVQEDSTSAWGDSNTADIGQTVNFQTTITAQQGAQNYVLHDKMDAGLTFDTSSVQVKLKKSSETAESAVQTSDYTVKNSGLESTNSCTFHVEFTQAFCNTLKANDQIIVTYSATLNEKAVIAGEGNKNETWLKYGDSSTTTHSTTTTKTFELPVFKYTGKDTPLKDAEFELKRNNETTAIALIKKTPVEGEKYTGDIYQVAKTGESGTVTSVTTTKSGKFKIKGLDADTYYLTEIKQPDGYNKLSAPITVVIGEDGTIKVDGSQTATAEVKVLNNTGTILPTTGGNGTSLIYFLGAVLALVSGVVLITKQRMKNS